MFRAMAMKELRETRGIVLLALAVYALLMISSISSINLFRGATRIPWDSRVPFINDSVPLMLCWVAAALAIALGLRQTVGESVWGTYPLLLHRPAGRRWLIGVKLLVGVGAYLVCAAIPLLIYCLWAATPGTHAGPFEWSMTLPAWVQWLAMMTLYLGAFLTGIRPGRWYRTRLLPLVGALQAAIVAMMISGDLWWCFLSCLVLAAMDAALMAAILLVVRTRDYS